MSDNFGGMNIDKIFSNSVDDDLVNRDSESFETIFSQFPEFRTDLCDFDDDDNDNNNNNNNENNINNNNKLEQDFSSFLPPKPSKLDPQALSLLDDTLENNIFNNVGEINFQQCFQQDHNINHQYSSDLAESLGTISPLFGAASLSRDYIGAHIKNIFSSSPYSPDTDAAKTNNSLNESGTPNTSVYASITDPPMYGKSIDFRSFVNKKQVPASTMKESPVGVFVGQLPSTYSEEDTAALLRAIGADANINVHVRDVKSHNQSRTCAFVVVNRTALPVLLSYSKRVLCDVSCVWVVGREQATQLKDYINSFLRDKLRGVPKAALVLEELTPQYMRGRGSNSKSAVKSAGRQDIIMNNNNNFNNNNNNNNNNAVGIIIPGGGGGGVGPANIFGAMPPPPPHPHPTGIYNPMSNTTNTTNNNNNNNNITGGGFFGAMPPPASSPQVNFYFVTAPVGGIPQQQQQQQQQQQHGMNELKPNTSAVCNNNNNSNSTSMTFPTMMQDPRVRYGGMPLLPPISESATCASCFSTISQMEIYYISPYDHSIMCIRCGGMFAGMNDNTQHLRGAMQFAMPQGTFSGIPQQNITNSLMHSQSLPSYPSSQQSSQTILLPQQGFNVC